MINIFIVKDSFGNTQCARCGHYCDNLTIDHFIPKCCRMSVNAEGNYVGLCEQCNHDKANRIVTPDWYTYLNDTQKNALKRYMRYARSYIISHTDDPEVINYINTKLKTENQY